MCYYTEQDAPPKNVMQRFNAVIDNEETYLQSKEIKGFDNPNIPIILNSSPNIITTDFTWGLLPVWAKTVNDKKNLNARIETIDEKPSFKNITQNRCLIIATGYYEWHWNDPKGKSKDKYRINSQDDEIFAFAGLYSQWENPTTGAKLNTYTMVTTQANKIMSYVHNHKKRMPIMLKKNDESLWLDNKTKIENFAYPFYDAELFATELNKTNYELF